MTDKKNPYRALHAILAALPPERRYLLDGVLRGEHPTDRRLPCGCAFGVAYPRARELDRLFDTEDPTAIYDEARADPSESGLDEEAQAEGNAFVDWVRGVGGDTTFLVNVVAANDARDLHHANDTETGALRYARVLRFLAEAADKFDAGEPVEA